jgi:hypothetical protein
VSAAPEGVGHRAAQEKAADRGGDHDQRKGYGEEVKGDERQDREGEKYGVIERSLPNPQYGLDHDGDDHGLDAVEEPRYRRYVRVGGREVGEEPQHEDRRDDEEGAGDDAAQGAVQLPADVGGDLLGLRPGQEHTKVECPQVLAL